MDIDRMLDTLAELRAQNDALMLERDVAIGAIYTAEIKAQVDAVNAEFAIRTDGVRADIARLEDNIKRAVIAHGATVKGATLSAVFAKGRVSWDDKGLAGYAVAHPELLAFRSEGAPSVSIRAVK